MGKAGGGPILADKKSMDQYYDLLILELAKIGGTREILDET